MLDVRRLFLIGLIFSWLPLHVAAEKRLAIIQFESDSLRVSQQERLMSFLRQRFSRDPRFEIQGVDFLRNQLSSKNKLRIEFERLARIQFENFQALERRLAEAKSQYLESRFSEVSQELASIWAQTNSAALYLTASFVADVLSYSAGAEYFLGNKQGARLYLDGLYSIGLSSLFRERAFPPGLREIFVELADNRLFPSSSFKIDLGARNVQTNFLGTSVSRADRQVQTLSLSLQHPLLQEKMLVFNRPKYQPVMTQINQLPQTINWQAFDQGEEIPRGVFAPLEGEAPARLLELLKIIDADLVLLGRVENENERWFVQGQIFEPLTRLQTSIVSRNASDSESVEGLESLANDLYQQLAQQIRKDGNLSSVSPIQIPSLPEATGVSKNRGIYQKWWFWTLIGAGVAGAGTGAYLLLKPEDRLQFEVRRAP